MVRAVIAVIGSYIVMFVLLFVCFTGLYLIWGAANAFRLGTYDVSHRWMAVSFALHFFVAAVAGMLCAVIARGGKAPIVLAVLVIALGLLFGILRGQPQGPNVRPRNVPGMEAMQKVRNPKWAVFALPFVTGIGVLAGSRLKRKT